MADMLTPLQWAATEDLTASALAAAATPVATPAPMPAPAPARREKLRLCMRRILPIMSVVITQQTPLH